MTPCEACQKDREKPGADETVTWFCFRPRRLGTPETCKDHDGLEGSHHGRHARIVERVK